MKYLNWDTGNLLRRAKMSHKLRSMMKRRDRELLREFDREPPPCACGFNSAQMQIPPRALGRAFFSLCAGRDGDRPAACAQCGDTAAMAAMAERSRAFYSSPCAVTDDQTAEVHHGL